jgi:hypothetical protein
MILPPHNYWCWFQIPQKWMSRFPSKLRQRQQSFVVSRLEYEPKIALKIPISLRSFS